MTHLNLKVRWLFVILLCVIVWIISEIISTKNIGLLFPPNNRRSTAPSSVNAPHSALIPNVVHYVVDFKDHAMDFRFYLSVRSVLKYIKPVKIICHCVVEPFDTIWWKAAKRSSGDKLQFKLIENAELINQTTLEFKSQAYRNNARMDVLLQEGGILFESNRVAFKSFDALLTHSPVSVFHGGIIMSEQNNSFLRMKLAKGIDSENLRNSLFWLSKGENTVDASLSKNIYIPSESDYLLRTTPRYSDVLFCLKRGSDVRNLVENILLSKNTNKDPIPPNFHYIWKASSSRDLTFFEYLSIKSLCIFGYPVKIYFHFTTWPKGERWEEMSSIKKFKAMHHSKSGGDETRDLYDVLWKEGGILLEFGVFVISKTDPIRLTGIFQSTSNDSVTNSLLGVPAKSEELHDLLTQRNSVNPAKHLYSGDILLEDECILKFESIDEASNVTACRQWKDHIWVTIHDTNDVITNASLINTMNGIVGEVLRYVMYGVSALLKPSLFKVPNIVHFVWFGNNKPLEFRHFLSMISAHFIQKPDKIYIHYDTLPVGKWWKKLGECVPNMELVKTQPNSTLGGKTVKWVQHKADYTRILALKKYGGIYADTDLYFVNSLDPLRVYDYVMTRDTGGLNRLWNGLILSTKGNNFLDHYEETYKDYHNADWGYNSLRFPYLLWLKNRNSVQFVTERKVAVIDSNGLYARDEQFYWKDNYAVHLFFKGRLPKDTSLEDAIYSDAFYNTTVGEVLRKVYEMYLFRTQNGKC